MSKMNNISFLLGAGFSAPNGYPIGNELGSRIKNAKNDNISFSSCGSIIEYSENNTSHYDHYFRFLTKIIDLYAERNEQFNYEEFYDFLSNPQIKDDVDVTHLCKSQLYDMSINDWIFQSKLIFNKLVNHYIRNDRNETDGNIISEYGSFCNCLNFYLKNNVVNIHTLNHDTLFEREICPNYVKMSVSDGFSYINTICIGLDYENDNRYVPIPYYADNYPSTLRFYKLHGSKDYFRISEKKESYFVKCNNKIDYTSIGTVLHSTDKNMVFEEDFSNHHPIILSGKSTKSNRYTHDPFCRLFQYFINNLKQSDILIVVGYGWNDTEINNMIIENYGRTKLCFIVDPYFDEKKSKVIEALGLIYKNISKKISQLSLSDFQIQ